MSLKVTTGADSIFELIKLKILFIINVCFETHTHETYMQIYVTMSQIKQLGILNIQINEIAVRLRTNKMFTNK